LIAGGPRRHLGISDSGIRVQSGFPCFQNGAPSRVEGFLTATTTIDNRLSLEQGVAYFTDQRFAEANVRTSLHEVIWDNGVDRSIVRTGVEMPWPLQNREFLHGVAVQINNNNNTDSAAFAMIVYVTLSEEEEATLPPAWDTYLRCTTYPSGQRITVLPDNALKMEHGMTYPLGGWIGPWIQNTIFHSGHVAAYVDEWTRMRDVMSKE